MGSRNQQANRRTLSLETLECRDVPSASWILAPGGNLMITGDAIAKNNVVVNYDIPHTHVTVTDQLTKTSQTFDQNDPAQRVNHISFQGGANDDVFRG